MGKVRDTTKFSIERHGPIVERWPAGPVEVLRFENGVVEVRCVCAVNDDEGLRVSSLGISHDVTWPPGEPPTLSPSLKVDGGGPGGVHIHGYVTDGVWTACGDDRSVPLP